jgi:hypothetical protein
MAEKASGSPTPDQPCEAIGADVRASLAALREDVGSLADDFARLVQNQRIASRGLVFDLETELQNRIRENPLTAVLILTFFGYAFGRLRSWRRAH